jgi:hypothetical protein
MVEEEFWWLKTNFDAVVAAATRAQLKL